MKDCSKYEGQAVEYENMIGHIKPCIVGGCDYDIGIAI